MVCGFGERVGFTLSRVRISYPSLVWSGDPAISMCCSFGPWRAASSPGWGTPPVLRRLAAHFVDMSTPALVDAIGDVCSRVFTAPVNRVVTFPCSERPLGLNLQPLIQISV